MTIIVTCRDCGAQVEAGHASRRFCAACGKIRVADRQRRWNAANRERICERKRHRYAERRRLEGAATVFIVCQDCGVQVEGQRRDRKFCAACRKVRKVEQHRREYIENREHILERRRRWGTKNREHLRRYYAENGEILREQARRRRAANREYVRDRQRRYYAENHERVLELQQLYRAANRERISERDARYREQKTAVMELFFDAKPRRMPNPNISEKEHARRLEKSRRYRVRHRKQINEFKRKREQLRSDALQAARELGLLPHSNPPPHDPTEGDPS